VQLHLGTPAPWAGGLDGVPVVQTSANDPDQPVLEVAWHTDARGMRMRYVDGTEFHVRADGREVWASWSAPMTKADAVVYLVGPVLGYVLRRLGVLALHASGCVIDGRAFAFCGSRGSGKSTLAAALALGGMPALSDDVLALRPSPAGTMAAPGYESLRVWDDSARFLVGDENRLPLLTPNWEKRAFTPAALGGATASTAAPLGGVFLMQPRADDPSAPRVEPVSPTDAFLFLTASTSANYLLDGAMRADEFVHLSALVAEVPVFRLVPHSDPARLSELTRVVAACARRD
jgi:hypothetical protein